MSSEFNSQQSLWKNPHKILITLKNPQMTIYAQKTFCIFGIFSLILVQPSYPGNTLWIKSCFLQFFFHLSRKFVLFLFSKATLCPNVSSLAIYLATLKLL
jgi:hypothetical protein